MYKYKTIEADIENGYIKGPEIGNLPSEAHVLITLLPVDSERREKQRNNWPPDFFEKTAGSFADSPLVREGQGVFEERDAIK